MNATELAVQFIIRGYVVVPEVIVGGELDAMRSAFEGLAGRLGKRSFSPGEVEQVPEFVNFIGHPRLMPVIEAFMGHYGHTPAVAWLQLCRDIYDPAKPPPPPFDTATDARKLSIHNDASNAKANRFSYNTLNMGLASFVFMDDTFPDAGCIVQCPGTHHLTTESAEGWAISPSQEFIWDHCSLEFVGVKAGDVVLQRAFNFHGVGPAPRHKRRQLRADYTPMALYHHLTIDSSGPFPHQRFSPKTMELLPVERRRYFVKPPQ